MNSKQAIERIMKILNLAPQKFYSAKTEQGMAVQIEGELELGAPIYISTEEGMIPAPDGVHKLDDGSEIEVSEGKISKIKMGDMEVEEEKEEADIKDEDMSAAEKFGDVKLKDGSIMRVGGDMPAVGLQVKKVGYDGNLSAMTDGVYETADGKSISIVGGAIDGIQSQKDKEAQGKFTIAESAQGAKLESPTFDVGEKVEVLGEDGAKSPAPDGEHQVVLKDESGNENKIRFVTKDGVITERSNVEEEKMSEEKIAEIFAMALRKLENKIDNISAKTSELESKFQKFSKEPAGEKVYNQKTITEKTFESDNKFERFKKMKESLSSK